ncbi:hypothetical protein DI005_32575 [Prauserella sp. PE36]|uniref:YciI family protein n=1 Tax=Prauserella sp. PE36 TaxID=1504709 RepID=UPI000D9E80A9|nr:YciI family protein [Prauserella sp. PE36]PXY30024.1 hypothetical protein BAY59_12385 [Prauserella coralliicola]RBM12558.1 hypothetical protein DI005_32575 [Prauserella sp. PE36]
MKYLLLMHYRVEGVPPMETWRPEEIKAHIAFQQALFRELTASGELLDGQGLSGPEAARIVTSDGGEPVVTDGPFAESKEFLAGYWLVDVPSDERAIEIAAKASAAPGPGGRPIRTPIEVRPVPEFGPGASGPGA